jgi:glycosyltransferase involved in cell wall biosynthesis
LGLREERVINISSAIDGHFKPRHIGRYEEEALRIRYGLTRSFVMYTGGIDARKNIERLIEAYAQLAPSLRRLHQLAIVCSVQDFDRKRLMELASRNTLQADELILTGYVPDDDLVALYNLCHLFIFPSLHEGFGLPALEAMACGAPVIGANTSSIPEVIGREDALFDPAHPQTIAKALNHALTDEGFRQDLRAHAPKQAAKFSWVESAQRALQAFEALSDRSRDEHHTQVHITSLRPRLAYVSPVPPEQSGIADYSAELLPELARYYDIVLILDQANGEHPWLSPNFPSRSVPWFKTNAHGFDRILYHFGNSAYHKHMFGLLAQHPGVVVLHDFFLSGAINWMDIAGGFPGMFLQTLYASHGYPALLTEKSNGRETAIWTYPCNKTVLEQAVGVIVHSRYSINGANQWYGTNTTTDWCLIPHLRSVSLRRDRNESRRQLGLNPDDFVVCSFGMLGPSKLNLRLLQTWLSSTLAQDPHCHLVFVGENQIGDYGNNLLRMIKRSSLHSRIRITGFVSPDLYRAHLDSADVAVQLRGQSRGETSRAVLDCLAHGLPLIINANGPMSDYPEDIMIKLPDDFCDAALTEALERLWRDMALRSQLAEAGTGYMREHHHPSDIGALYYGAIEHFAREGSHAIYRRSLKSLSNIASPVAPTEDDLMATATCISSNRLKARPKHLLVDVSGIVQRDARASLQPYIHGTLLHLLHHPPSGFRVEPVYMQGQYYRYARKLTSTILNINTILEDDILDIQCGDVYLGLAPLALFAPSCNDNLGLFPILGVEVYFIVYDLAPILKSDCSMHSGDLLFRSWFSKALPITDGLICTSEKAADELKVWLEEHPLNRVKPIKIAYFHICEGDDEQQTIPSNNLILNMSHAIHTLTSLS